jgi:hypothetical protein
VTCGTISGNQRGRATAARRGLAATRVCATTLVLLFLSGGSLVEGAALRQGLSVDFVKEVPTEPGEEEVRGTVYHAPPDLTLIEVTHPISQRVLVDTSYVTIYYPSEERAIRLPSSGPMTLLFLQAFLGIADADLDLVRYGFKINRTEVRSDSLFVWWDPPTLLASGIGRARTAFSEDRLAEVSFFTDNGGPFQRTRFSDYILHAGRAYPMTIELSIYVPEPRTEIYRLSSPMFDRALPDSLLSLRLPPDVEIEDTRQ